MTTVGKDGNIEFRFFRPGVMDVTLAGDFAGKWANRQTMRPEANGWWALELDLDPGEYRFRYVADGEWFTDFASNGVEYTNSGWNSVLVVAGDSASKMKGNSVSNSSRGTLKVA